MNGSPTNAIFLAVSIALFVFFMAYIIIAKVSASKRLMSERVTKIAPMEKSVLVEFRDNEPERSKRAKKKKKVNNKKLMDIIEGELTLAGIKMKAEEFGVLWMMVTFGPSGLVALLSDEGKGLMPSVTLAVFGAVLPIIILKRKKNKRIMAFEKQLADALIVTCNCLRSGLSFQQAMETIAKEMTEPINVEFGRALSEMQYGVPLDKALNNLGTRIKSSDLMLTVSAVNIQKQTGGNLSEILETISETIKERSKIKSDIRTMTAQGRISGMIIGVLPIALGGLLMVINPDYMMMLFEERVGQMLLIVAIVMEVTAFSIIKKIVNVKY